MSVLTLETQTNKSETIEVFTWKYQDFVLKNTEISKR
jgi:hypothetical protein